MSDLAIRFEEACAAHVARGYTEKQYGVSMGDLESIARYFHLTMENTIALYKEWRKAQVA